MVEDQVLHRESRQMTPAACQEQLQAEQICPHLQWEAVLEILVAVVMVLEVVGVQVLLALGVLKQRLLVDVKVVEEEGPFSHHHYRQCFEG